MNKKNRLVYSLICISLLLMSVLSVSAGSISGLDYNDCTAQGFWWWSGTCVNSIPQTINDGNVYIVADTSAHADYADTSGNADTVDGRHYWQIRNAFRNADQQRYDEVMSNDARWSRDRVSGFGSDDVERMLTGSYDYTRDFDNYNEFVLAQLATRMLMQQDEIVCLIEYGVYAADFDIVHCMARRVADRTGEQQFLADGYQCGPKMCVKFYEIPVPSEEKFETAGMGPELWQYEALAHWDMLCARGFQKWCVISEQNREEWGMN